MAESWDRETKNLTEAPMKSLQLCTSFLPTLHTQGRWWCQGGLDRVPENTECRSIYKTTWIWSRKTNTVYPQNWASVTRELMRETKTTAYEICHNCHHKRISRQSPFLLRKFLLLLFWGFCFWGFFYDLKNISVLDWDKTTAISNVG